MKDKIEKLIALTKEAGLIENELNSLVQKIGTEYMKHEDLIYSNNRCQISSFDWRMQENGKIFCNYDEYWSYGGHEQGTFSFPSIYLYDSEAFEAFKNDCLVKQKNRIEEQKKQNLAYKQSEYNRLKKELEADLT